jgi:hypothetical protein
MKKRKQSGSYSFDTRFYDEQDLSTVISPLIGKKPLRVSQVELHCFVETYILTKQWRSCGSCLLFLDQARSLMPHAFVFVACQAMILTDGLFKKVHGERGTL